MSSLRALVALIALPALFLAAGAASGTAGGPVGYVDPAGTCAGLNPCYTSIQQAVRLAGPPPAVVYIFPGTYSQSVNLDQMGDDIGGEPGMLTLQAVNAQAVPEAGTATINGAGAPAIWAQGSGFGQLSIHGLNVASSGTSGISLVLDGSTDVVIRDVNASNTGDDGIYLEEIGDLTVTRLTANENASDGIEAYANGDIVIEDSVANENLSTSDGDGFDLEALGDVRGSHLTATNNAQEGIDFSYVGGTATLTDCLANVNGGDGIDIDSAVDGLIVDGCIALGNGSDGMEIGDNSDAPDVSDVIIQNSSAENNTDEGIDLSLSGAGTVHCVNISNNNHGFRLDNGGAVNAEGNWWGSLTGPTHPTNPGGTGNTVIDAANGEEGTVDFVPFFAEPCSPARTLMWGNLNCDGLIDGYDALLLVTFQAGIAVTPPEDCPALDATFTPEGFSQVQWADLNCDGVTDGDDLILLLRSHAALNVPEPPAGCPTMGQEISEPD